MSYNFFRDWTANPNTGSGTPGQPPGYNNPWYDPQLQGQIGGQGSFQPMPDQYGSDTNPIWNTQPVQPDYYGGPQQGQFPGQLGNGSTPDGSLNRNAYADWFNQLQPTSPNSGFSGSGSMGRDPSLNYTSGGGDVPNPDVMGVPKNSTFPGGLGAGSTGTATGAPVATPDLPPTSTGTGSPIGVMPGMNYTDPNSILPKQGGVDNSMPLPSQGLGTASGPVASAAANIGNLYGQGPGWQQGFNELYNKQFVSGQGDFNSVFGSTQGGGAGNNFNWNIQPNVVTDNLSDPAFRAQAEAIARANPTIDFEPTLVDGKWYLASRARDTSAQKSLLAPVLPPTAPTGGGSAGGAKSSSGGGYSNTYGNTGGGGKATPNLPTSKGATGPANGTSNLGGKLGIGPNDANGAHLAAPYKDGDVVGGQVMQGGKWYPVSGAINQPYVPTSGTGSGYVPMNPFAYLINGAQEAIKQTQALSSGKPYEGQVSPDGSQVFRNGKWVYV